MALEISIPATATMALVVEDPLTRGYLKALWRDPIDVAFVLGGGNEGVEAIVRSFREEGFPNVFGVTDRDFGSSNHADWTASTKTFRTFILPVHEIENYLLDAEALEAGVYHNRNLSVDRIEEQMVEKARSLCWWSACRETIAELKRRFRRDFIADPKQTIVDEAGAWNHICGSRWFKKLPDEAARSTGPAVRRILADERQKAERRLESGDWRRDFSGKEIFKDVAGWICDETKLPSRKPRMEFFNDVAEEIADWQVANGKTPQDLADLLRALRNRLAR